MKNLTGKTKQIKIVKSQELIQIFTRNYFLQSVIKMHENVIKMLTNLRHFYSEFTEGKISAISLIAISVISILSHMQTHQSRSSPDKIIRESFAKNVKIYHIISTSILVF